jgi:hypothetical protein
MLAVKHYPPQQVSSCRAAVAKLLEGDAPGLGNAAVLVLDHWFVHRQRGAEGKDGNPMNEVRVLAESIVHHDGILTVDGGIDLRPETSVLGLGPGAAVDLDREDAARLAGAYLAAIERTYVATGAA